MESLRDLFVRLGLDWDAAGFAQAQVAVDVLEKGLQLAVQGANALAHVFIDSVNTTAAFGEEMEVLAQKTGIGVESLQKLGYAASLSHSSAEEMRVGLGHLARQLEAAKGGGAEAIKNFTSLGLSMDEVRDKSPEEMVMLIADRMQAMGAGTARTAAAMGVLGKSGANLIPTLAGGSEGLRAMGVEAEELNVIMSAEGIAAAAAYKQGVEKLEQAGMGLQRMIAGPLIEALTPLVDGMVAWMGANKDLIRQKIHHYVGLIASGLKGLGRMVAWVVKRFDGFVLVAKLVAVAIGSTLVAALLLNIGTVATAVSWYVAFGVAATVAAVKAAVAWLAAAAPIVLIAGVLALAALAAEDFYVFLKGGDSMLGRFITKVAELGTSWFIANKDWWVVSSLKEAIRLANMLATAIEMMDPTGLLRMAGMRAQAIGGAAPEAGASMPVGTMEQANEALSRAMGGGGAWQTTGSAAKSAVVNATINVAVPSGTPPPLVKQALKEVVAEQLNGVMRDAGASTGNGG